MILFKGILHRSLAWTMKLAPYTAANILPVLKTSAKAAVSTCTGGNNGRLCGFTWSEGKFDNSSAPAQASVLAALVSVLQNTVSTNSSDSGSNGGSTGTSGGSGNGGAGNSSNPTGNGGSMGSSIGISFTTLVGSLIFATLLG
jgi:mannan endo-1,6-alpha-mannosidase